MDVYVSDISSVQLLRRARGRCWPRVEECLDRTVGVPPSLRSQWWRDGIAELAPLLTIDERHPLHLHVSCEERRIRARSIECDILSPVLPEGSFMLAVLSESGSSVRIDSGGLSFGQLAGKLARAERRGDLSRAQARALLIDFGMELTGNYARNEVNPLTDDCYFFVGRATSADGIRMWCDNACRVRGAKYARRISRDVMDGSQSPRETLHAIILSSPPELGGLGLERPLLNVPLQLSSQERLLINGPSMCPDLYFPDLGFAIEHQGGPHGTSAQYAEDASRSQVYAALGITLFETSRRDVWSAAAYDIFLHRLIHRLAADHGTRLGRRLTEIVDDPVSRRTRWSVIDVLTDGTLDPWLL